MKTLALLALLSASVGGADLNGVWVAERPSPMGGQPMRTFWTFKADGTALTGTITSPMGDVPIAEGKIDGENFSFVQIMRFGGNERRVEWKGKVEGEQLKIQSSGFGPPPGMGPSGPGGAAQSNRPPGAGGGGMRGPMEMTAHRATKEEIWAKDHPYGDLPTVTFPALKELPDNGLARTPPMGWNSWNHFRAKIDDKTIREVADALVSSGMKDAGYVYLNIDDGWQGKRDANGVLQPNERFPDMKALADYVHSKGLKLGIYSSPGPRTCAQFEGSYGHEQLDAKTWAAWGIDYLKYDWCSARRVIKAEDMRAAYQKMGEALRATGRPIVYALCQYGEQNVGEWGPKVGGNVWRTTGDIRDTWQSMAQIGFSQNGQEKYAGPGRWNDPDMLEVGNGGMTTEEYRTHMTLWSMLASPLLAGNDVRQMTPEIHEILTKRDVVAVSQDKLGKQGYRVAQQGDTEVWVKPLAGGAHAIALFNKGGEAAKVTADLAAAGLKGKVRLRDLWKGSDAGTAQGQYSVDVPSHGAVLLRASK